MTDIARINAVVLAALFSKFKDLEVFQKREERMTNIWKNIPQPKVRNDKFCFWFFCAGDQIWTTFIFNPQILHHNMIKEFQTHRHMLEISYRLTKTHHQTGTRLITSSILASNRKDCLLTDLGCQQSVNFCKINPTDTHTFTHTGRGQGLLNASAARMNHIQTTGKKSLRITARMALRMSLRTSEIDQARYSQWPC